MPNIQFTLLPRSIQIRLLCGNNTSFDGSTPYFVARKNSSPDRCKRSGPERNRQSNLWRRMDTVRILQNQPQPFGFVFGLQVGGTGLAGLFVL